MGIVVEADHTCMTLRGVRDTGSCALVTPLLGALREASARALNSLRRPGLSG